MITAPLVLRVGSSALPAEGLLGGRHAVRTAIAPTPAATATARPAAAAGSARSAPATGARRPRVRDVHGDLAAVEVLAVQLGDGPLRLLGGRHLDEAEAPGLAGELVRDHGRRLHGPALGEVLSKGLTGRGIGQTTHVQFRSHMVLLRSLFRFVRAPILGRASIGGEAAAGVMRGRGTSVMLRAGSATR